MKNIKGNALITIIIIILIILILSGIGFVAYEFLKISKQTGNNVEFANGEDLYGEIQNNTDIEEPILNKIEEPILNEIEDPNNNEQTETFTSRYYYSQLDSYGKMIYDKLKQNKEQLITGTYVFDFGTNFNTLLHSEKGQETLNKAFQSAWNAFSYDECELFYIDIKKMNLINETRSLGGITTYYISIGPGDNKNYLQDNFQTRESIEKAQNYINNIIENIIKQTQNVNRVNKIKKVHDWLIDAIEYDTSGTNANKYNIYGAMHDRKAVCEGYARTFKYVMEKLQVPCVLISGTAKNSQETTEAHAWNYVQIEEQWYAVDLTWDDPVITGNGKLTDTERYKFFLIGSEKFLKDHTPSGEISENSMIFTLPTLSITNYENY